MGWVRGRFGYLGLLWEQKALSRWAALLSLLYTLFVVWRDEFATPEQQENIRGIKMLPNWPLSVWVCIFLVLLCFWIFEASYRLHKNLKDAAAFGLGVTELRANIDSSNAERFLEIWLGLTNTTDAPLLYKMLDYTYSLSNCVAKTSETPSSVIQKNKDATFLPGAGISLKNFIGLPDRGEGKATIKMKFGNANIGLSRLVDKEISLVYKKINNGNGISISWVVRTEQETPL